MALKQWLIEKELAKRNADRDLLLNTSPRDLRRFQDLVASTLENTLKNSLEKSYPRFEISFSSEEMSEALLQLVVLDSLDSVLASEGIGYSISSKETKRIRGERQGPEPYNYVKVCGTVAI